MRADTEVALARSMTAPLNLRGKPQPSVLLSRVAEASLLEKSDLGTVDRAAIPAVLPGGDEQ